MGRSVKFHREQGRVSLVANQELKMRFESVAVFLGADPTILNFKGFCDSKLRKQACAISRSERQEMLFGLLLR